jgi:serine-type D-Ala-D-Ala carboxypeptidase
VSVDSARHVVATAIAARVFPAAALEVGNAGGALWAEAMGTLTFDQSSPATAIAIGTCFDLASLTKVIATTTIVMELVGAGAVHLDERVSAFFPEWRGADRELVTVRDLLEHASGLPARLLDPPPVGRREFEHEICHLPLEHVPRTASIYSDLGFILLGFLAADRGGASLDQLFSGITMHDQADSGGNPDLLSFELTRGDRERAAPTLPMDDDLRRGRRLQGEVHDNYAAALGGVAGHAGLFGTAGAVGAFARGMLAAARGSDAGPFSPAGVATFLARSSVAASSRALGWDTMLPTSSCGSHMSRSAFGHVGFTGTSLWIDPVRDRYFVLLTNRACGGGTLDEMRSVRRAFHDALADV